MLRRRVLLVEDHPMYRRGLRRLLEEQGRFHIVGEAVNGHQAIHLAEIHRPDLILLDVALPGITGLKTARILRKQHDRIRLVFLSVHLDESRLFDAMRLGAAAFLTKDLDAEPLLDALRRVAAGENLLNAMVLSRPALAVRLLTEFRAVSGQVKGSDIVSERYLPLSPREIEVLDCVAQGLSNKEIAEELFVSEQTVKNHMTSVLRKLNVNDRVQAILFAIKSGWMEIGPQPYAAVALP